LIVTTLKNLAFWSALFSIIAAILVGPSALHILALPLPLLAGIAAVGVTVAHEGLN
jgi:hypothetical protein